VEYDNPLPGNVAVESPSDTLTPMNSKFEQTAPQGAGVRHSNLRAEVNQEFNQPSIVRQQPSWPTFDLVPNSNVKILDRIRHRVMLANTRTEINTRANSLASIDRQADPQRVRTLMERNTRRLLKV